MVQPVFNFLKTLFEGIFDVRQHALLQSLPVHSGAINSIVVNDVDGYFITGSSEGDIKVHLIVIIAVSFVAIKIWSSVN